MGASIARQAHPQDAAERGFDAGTVNQKVQWAVAATIRQAHVQRFLALLVHVDMHCQAVDGIRC